MAGDIVVRVSLAWWIFLCARGGPGSWQTLSPSLDLDSRLGAGFTACCVLCHYYWTQSESCGLTPLHRFSIAFLSCSALDISEIVHLCRLDSEGGLRNMKPLVGKAPSTNSHNFYHCKHWTSTTTMARKSRHSRSMKLVGISALFSCTVVIPGADAFVPGHSFHLPLHKNAAAPRPLPALSVMASGSIRNGLVTSEPSHSQKNHQSHPTNEENQEMLGEAVELRRLKKIEEEHLLLSNKQSLPTLTICRAAGYGDDLHAYEDAIDRGHAAREALITRNIGLVHFCVKKIVGTKKAPKRVLQSLSTEDLIQEGSIGLSRAIDKWNPEIGGRFSTYAMYWIRASVLRCIAERDDLVRVPVHVSSSVRKMTAAAKQLGLDLNMVDASLESPSWKEAKEAKQLAEAAGLSEAELDRAIQIQRRRSKGGIRSFETWMQKGMDLDADHPGLGQSHARAVATPSSQSDMEYLRSELAKFLRPKEVEALSWRYGLTQDSEARALPESPVSQGRWGEAMSFVEIGKRMHVSAEYCRKLCHKAVSKLQLAHEEGHLEPIMM